jgi:uncharacterized membrane protein YphA (DoxX/SURF4 family)
MAVSRSLARPLLASTFVAAGVNSLQHSETLASRAKPVADRIRTFTEKRLGTTAPTEVTLVRVNAATHIVCGLGLATGRMPRTSALVLAASLVPTTLGVHRFWEESDPATRETQKVHFFKNLSLLGALIIAAGDTEGRPGLAWRAKHAVTDARETVVAHLPT